MNLIEAGINWIGCCEKLNTHREIIDTYNAHQPLSRGYKVKYNDAWCMTFASACAIKAKCSARFPYECSCQKAVEKLMREGLWFEGDDWVPMTNDLIFYHWGHTGYKDCLHRPNHVGIVAGVDNGIIYCLEGNYSDSVKWREVPINWSKIRGFGRTSYIYQDFEKDIDLIANQVKAGKYDGTDRDKMIKMIGYEPRLIQNRVNILYERENKGDEYLLDVAMECIRGKWGNNPERKKALTEAGYDYQAVQDIINNYYKSKEGMK